MTSEVVRAPRRPLATHIIGIAASAGGLSALSRLLGALPASLPASLLVVQHLQQSSPSYLAEILQWHTRLAVERARSGAVLRIGTVYVSPPGVHLIVGTDRRVALSHLPPVHYCRPSGDRLFASFGPSFGNRAIAVVLTGAGRDGAEGAQDMRRYGGTVIVQDERSAAFPGMPRAALQAGTVDRVLPLDIIAPTLIELVGSGDPT
jgi:two-component system, chemotaxis family, protein-glutamate methylesterase/glutaminase